MKQNIKTVCHPRNGSPMQASIFLSEKYRLSSVFQKKKKKGNVLGSFYLEEI